MQARGSEKVKFLDFRWLVILSHLGRLYFYECFKIQFPQFQFGEMSVAAFDSCVTFSILTSLWDAKLQIWCKYEIPIFLNLNMSL